MAEMLVESLSEEELRQLTAAVNAKAIAALLARGVAPDVYTEQLDALVRAHCTKVRASPRADDELIMREV